MPLFGGRKKKEKEKEKRKQPSPEEQQFATGKDYLTSKHNYGSREASPGPGPATVQDLVASVSSDPSPATRYPKRQNSNVAKTREYFEKKALENSTDGNLSLSPEKRRRREDSLGSGSSGTTISASGISISSPIRSQGSFTSVTSGLRPSSRAVSGSGMSTTSEQNTALTLTLSPNRRDSYPAVESIPEHISDNVGKEKTLGRTTLPLPPLLTTTVKHRPVTALKNVHAPGGGFGFILRKSYLPVPEDPDKTRLVHLVEPRSDYLGPLMTGDRIIEVNGENVDNAPHERVVDLIKASGDSVDLLVASMPELLELNMRGALDDQFQPISRSNQLRKSGRAKQGTGTLRKKAVDRKAFKAKSVEEVLSEKDILAQERVWVVHPDGFTLGNIVHDFPRRSTAFSTHYTLVRFQGRDISRVKLQHSGEIIEVEEENLEKANLASQDKVEDIVNLVHLNESSVLHVLRQRYGSSLIHTFAGRHLIVMNPLRPLSSYVDRVIDMFRGCRREDMPPHIFAAGQQAFRNMMVTRSDQSLILMGLSGSGKTFNARYLLRYLATIGQHEHGSVTNAKLDAVELLLHSFGSAATFLNPQATRCACLYSLDFDPSSTTIGATVRTFLLEKTRVAQRPTGEGNFNIFYQLIAGADEQLKADLLLNIPVESDEPNLYIEPHDDPQRIESAAYVWDLIQNCLDILDISQEEAMGIWSLLAAIYHLGFAGAKPKGSVRGGDCFLNPAAAQRAAAVLGLDHEDLGRDIFSPPRGASLRISNLFASPLGISPSPSDTTSMQGSLFASIMGVSVSSNRPLALDAFVSGLYDQAFNALILMINRALQSPVMAKVRSSIHVLDTPGFQHRELAGASYGASFDDLCMNYAQERLQMLFHDFTFTSEQDRYLQENINWMFSEIAASPLPVIDTIDKHVPQRRGIDFHTDRRGLLWILDEESVFPGASDNSFLERVHMYHGEPSERGERPLIKALKEDNQFVVSHCHQTLPILYDANGWVRRAREHPSFRVVVQVVAESKRPSIAAIFQGRGVAATVTNMSSSALKVDTYHQTLQRSRSSQSSSLHIISPVSTNIKKSSVCLQPKFQLDFLMDVLRKTRQWFIRCILPQPPYKLPGALPYPDSEVGSPKLPGPAPHGQIDVPLVRAQLRRADIVKAARIYKQGFPEHMTFPEFRRRYGALLPLDYAGGPGEDTSAVQQILRTQEVDANLFRVGLSQVFFRAGTLTQLDCQVEERTHDTMVLFQARCRGWVARERFKMLEIKHSAAYVIQQNVGAWLEFRDWSWWKLFAKVKPLLAVWRVEEDVREKDSQIEKLKGQVEILEMERNLLKESEGILEEKVTQMSAQLTEAQLSSNEATELLESEQLEKRTLQEQLSELSVRETELAQEKDQFQLQIAEMSILARIKQEGEGQGSPDAVLEKYWEARRELETLRQRVRAEHEDEIERLESSKRGLEKQLADLESERDDLERTLNTVRKKATKMGSELNDLKLHLESQQTRNAELEKRQRKFDTDLNAAKEESTSEQLAKEKLAKEKDTLHSDFDELQKKFKELQGEHERMQQEKEDLESEVLSSTSKTTESELTSFRRMKRELESKVEELEDELDEVNVRMDTLQQSKARLELANQTLKQQHQKELEARDEEMEQLKSSMTKKLKTMGEQVEELHEEKQQAVKAKRDMERELMEYQGRLGDPEKEKKLKKQVQKHKALVQDLQEELDREREMRSNSVMVKSLRNQLDDLQASESAAVKAHKRLQDETDELQIQIDELTRAKLELESRVSDLSREKSDLESRVEEEQDEIEDLMEKQRSHISQMTSIQAQLSESHIQIDELRETKEALESKLSEMTTKVSELDSGINRHQYEASEIKVRELEQKLELERSSARRHEAQIHRLRSQLERFHEEKSEDVSHKSSDALRRMQKQLRELRNELQEAERKEQDQLKKRRATETQLQEVEAQLQTTQADLKSSQQRIRTLHSALTGHEDSIGDETFSPTRDISFGIGELSDESDGSYQIGEFDDDDDISTEGLSDDEFATSRLTRRRRRAEITTTVSPRLSDDDFGISRRRRDIGSKLDTEDDLELTSSRRARSRDPEDDDLQFSTRRKDFSTKLSDEDDFTVGRKKRFSDDDLELTGRRSKELLDEDLTTTRRKDRLKVSGDEDDFMSRRKKTPERSTLLSDEELGVRSRRSRRDRSADLEDTEITPRRRRERIKLSDDDDDLLTGKKKTTSLLSDEDDLQSASRRRRERIKLSDEDNDLLTTKKTTGVLSGEDEDTGSRSGQRKLGDDDNLVASKGEVPVDLSDIRLEDTTQRRRGYRRRKNDGDTGAIRKNFSDDKGDSTLASRDLNGTTNPKHQPEIKAVQPTTTNGTLSKEDKPSPEEKQQGVVPDPKRKLSIDDIVTSEQQNIYSASRRRRRRRRTAEAESHLLVKQHQDSGDVNGIDDPAS